jgi:hypothetical protein
MSLGDLLAEILETGFRLVPIPARTGVRMIGNPNQASPVFLTGNYDLTLRRVRRALRGLDAYLVVANSHGVNVWCASSGGHLGTHQVVTALKVARLEERVVHREVIVPQLAATGVQAKEVRRRTGWIVRFGPADARDIPAYLAAEKHKTQAMREVRFDPRQRLEMAVAWATPISLIAAVPAWGVQHLAGAVALVWILALAVFFLYDRLPLPDRGRQVVLAVAATAGVSGALALAGLFTAVAVAGWSATALAVLALLTTPVPARRHPPASSKRRTFASSLTLAAVPAHTIAGRSVPRPYSRSNPPFTKSPSPDPTAASGVERVSSSVRGTLFPSRHRTGGVSVPR